MAADRLQSLGWEHYEVHEPEPHILLFKWVTQTRVVDMDRWLTFVLGVP